MHPLPNTSKPVLPTAAPCLTTCGVTYSYTRNAPAVVNNWTEQFTAGHVTALVGPSGCGKSTSLYLLALLLKVREGEIHYRGTRVDTLRDPDKAALRASEFGFVFQDAVLDPTRTVLDNIIETTLYSGASRKTARTHAVDLMDRFGVHIPPQRLPGQISGGQAQRIALCRALVANPFIVFADEPTGNLDPHSADVVLTALEQHAAAGGCVIIVTHDDAVVRRAHRVITLRVPERTPERALR